MGTLHKNHVGNRVVWQKNGIQHNFLRWNCIVSYFIGKAAITILCHLLRNDFYKSSGMVKQITGTNITIFTKDYHLKCM